MVEKKRILIIDDEPNVAELMKEWLEPSYAVDKALDGVEGLEKALEVSPDLIFLDVRMPKLDGFEVLRRLKADQRTSSIPVVMLSAEAHSTSLLDAQRGRAVDYAIKPIDMSSLVPFVRRYI